MVSLLVEPARLSYDFSIKNGTPFDSVQFARFLAQLRDTLNLIEDSGHKIAVNADLRNSFKNAIPCSVYSDSSLYRLAEEVINRKMSALFMPLVQNGLRSDLKFCFDSINVNAESPIYHEDIYEKWKMLAQCAAVGLVPKWIVRSLGESIFCAEHAILFDVETKKKVVMGVSCNIQTIIDSAEVTKFELLDLFLLNDTVIDVPCSGTGTHSSMWAKQIKKIEDVPGFERQLLRGLAKTRKIQRFQLLSFENKTAAVDDPSIEILNVKINDDGDVMECLLRGKGKKQHSQRINVYTKHGYGSKFNRAFDGVITLKKIEEFQKGKIN